MKSMRIILITLLFLALGRLCATSAQQAAPFSIRSSAQDKIVVELCSPQPQIERSEIASQGFSRISMEGAELNCEDGAPELPQFSTMVAIPPNASYSMTYELSQPVSLPNVKPQPVRDEPNAPALSAIYLGHSKYPSKQVNAAPDAWLRDFRILPLQVCPLSWDPDSNTLIHYGKIRITIELSYPKAQGGPMPYGAYSPAFRQLYEAQILNFELYRDPLPEPQSPRVLIIHGDNSDPIFSSQLDAFVSWKRQKGFEVNVANTSLAGSSSPAIKSYIQAQYDDPQTRPDFIILLGDVTGSFAVPTFYLPDWVYQGEGDYPYTYLSGDDMLGDVFIGRISAENVSQLVILFNKIYTYEKTVNLEPPYSDWMNRMLIIGDPHDSGRSCIYAGQFIHEIAEQANPEYEFIENYESGFAATINSGLNRGVGFFAYRGFVGVSGWTPSSNLINGFKMPHAVILTCITGVFAGGTSLSEEFIRMGTGSVPAGAITCTGMSTGGTHTAFNNALSAGIMSGIFCHGMRTMGEAVLNGKLYLHSTYAASHAESAGMMNHWCSLMGDPTLETWVGKARQLRLTAPTSIPSGTTILELSVNDSLSIPIEGVCVTAYSPAENTVVAKAFSGPDGMAVLILPQGLNEAVLITASIHDFKPIQQMTLIDAAGSLTYVAHQVTADDNTDGYANASETVSLTVELRNTTAAVLSGMNAILSTDNPMVLISQISSSYPDLVPGSSSHGSQPFVFNLNPAISPVEKIRFTLSVTDASTTQYQIVFYLRAYNACLELASYIVDYTNNGILDPGESCRLDLSIQNVAAYPALDLYGELSSLNSLLAVSDSVSSFGSALPSSQVVSLEGFDLQASPMLLPGMQLPLRLRLYNNTGFEQTLVFNLPVGTVSQNTPLGPDAYGYLIYDETDTAYPDCPVYDWIEIVPSLGGSGTLIPDLSDASFYQTEGDLPNANVLEELELPFSFRFYGVDYNRITVCVNGFLALGSTLNADYRNARIPGGQGPCPMIAPFWDDLYLPFGSGIYQYFDELQHYFIIQYHQLKNGYDRSSVETFQVIFYDPVYHRSGLGDGKIKIQYKTFNNVDIGNTGFTPWQGNYCTVGIKDHSNTRGLEYSFNNTYPQAAAPLMDQRALLITTIPVLHQTAHLVVEELIINDANQNELLESGETAELGILIHNLGQGNASAISCQLSSLSPYATVHTSQSSYPDLPAGASAINQISFVVSISPECPDASILSFLCEVSSGAGDWSYPVSLKTCKGEVSFAGYFINDAESNGNGILEPGETVTLIVSLKNSSRVAVQQLSASIACDNPLVTLLDTTPFSSSAPSQTTVQALFRFSLSGAASLGSDITLNLSYGTDQSTPQTNSLKLRIGRTSLSEDFEDSNGSYSPSPPNGWWWGSSEFAGSHSGTKVWGTRLDAPYSNNASWNLFSPPIYIGSDYVLEFWHFMDSQTGVDGGNVKYYNDAEGTWTLLIPEDGYPCANVSALGEPGFSGSLGWERVRFNLGTHLQGNVRFRWSFASDASIQGQGWFIDDVSTLNFSNFCGLLTGELTVQGTAPDHSQQWVSTQDGISSNPDQNGIYRLYLPLGTHSVQASAKGFLTDLAGDIVISTHLPTPAQDFQLIELKPVTGLVSNHVESTLTLSWEAPAEPFFPLTAYRVSRRCNAGAFETAQVSLESSYVEILSEPGTYQYYVHALYAEGESLPTPIWSTEFPFPDNPDTPPLVTKLFANYPNPFNPTTLISFDLATAGRVELNIYNLRGQLVNRLCGEELSIGRHSLMWNGRDSSGRRVASGVYLYRLTAPRYSQTRKMVMIK